MAVVDDLRHRLLAEPCAVYAEVVTDEG
jgi:hypothetical protein